MRNLTRRVATATLLSLLTIIGVAVSNPAFAGGVSGSL
jgi:hypothetical protein